LLSGTLSNSQTTLSQSATVNADSTDAGMGPCNLQTASTFQLAFGSGAPPGSFSGTMSYTYTPASGATCTDVLMSSGGMYDTLPCTVTYTVSATKQ
jgi:hypothetical protein